MVDTVPTSFLCPIGYELLVDPVILGNTGHTFERSQISRWLVNHNVDPLTNRELTDNTLITIYALLAAISDFVARTSGIMIASSDLIPGEVIRKSTHSTTFKAIFRGQPAAVFCLPKSEWAAEEAKMLVELGSHQHVARFHGRAYIRQNGNCSVVDNDNAEANSLVMEMTEQGDLATFLGTRQPLTTAHRLLIAEQIADGVCFIHAAGFTQSHLAPRNILIKLLDVHDMSITAVKVARVYQISDEPMWMRVRCMPKGASGLADSPSKESDVWAFGLLLWDLFAYAEVGHFSSTEARRIHIKQPRGCPHEVWTTMKSCWALDSNDRPTFAQLRITLQTLRATAAAAAAAVATKARISPLHQLASDAAHRQVWTDSVMRLYGPNISATPSICDPPQHAPSPPNITQSRDGTATDLGNEEIGRSLPLGAKVTNTAVSDASTKQALISIPAIEILQIPTNHIDACFLTQQLKSVSGGLHCYVRRDRRGTNRFSPSYTLHLQESISSDNRPILHAQQRVHGVIDGSFTLTMHVGDECKVLGRLESNFACTETVLYHEEDAQRRIRKEHAAIRFARTAWAGPRSMHVSMHVNDNGDHKQVDLASKTSQRNDINGRVAIASVKNFQLVDSDENILLQVWGTAVCV